MFFLFLYPLIFLIVFLGVLLIALAIYFYNASKILKNQTLVNNQVNDLLKIKTEFVSSKKFYLNDNISYNKNIESKKIIIVDSENKKICFVDYLKGSILLVNFNEILNYEVYENGNNVTTGAGIGGFGTGIFGATTNKNCKELRLIIRLKKFDNPQITYNLISNTILNFGVDKSSLLFQNCISSLQEVVSFLEIVKHDNEKK